MWENSNLKWLAQSFIILLESYILQKVQSEFFLRCPKLKGYKIRIPHMFYNHHPHKQTWSSNWKLSLVSLSPQLCNVLSNIPCTWIDLFYVDWINTSRINIGSLIVFTNNSFIQELITNLFKFPSNISIT
jgi:hypothetical protein